MKSSLAIFCLIILTWVFWYKYQGKEPSCLYLRSGKVFDGLSQKYRENIDIQIDHGKITKIGPRNKPPAECKVLDAYSWVVVPGLIDSHTHLLLGTRKRTMDLVEIIERSLRLTENERLEMGKANALSMVRSGFTTVRDLGNSGNFIDLKLKQYLVLNPQAGPDLISSGPGLAVTPSQVGRSSDEYRVVKSIDDIKNYVQSNSSKQLNWIKVYADNDPQVGFLGKDFLKAIISESHKIGILVALHAINKDGAKMGIELGVDSIEHFYEVPEVPFSPKYFPSLVLTDSSQRQCAEFQKFTSDTLYKNCLNLTAARAARIQWARTKGFNIVFGSDSYVDINPNRGQDSIEALTAFQEGGLTPFEALQTVGVNAAKMLGRSDIGKLVDGADADILVIEGDPLLSLQDLKKTRIVIKKGKIICLGQSSCQGEN